MKLNNERFCQLSLRNVVPTILLLAITSVAADGAGGNAVRRPNIVFLMADQWRASAMGYAGDTNVKTPNLDKLAAQGFRFENAVSVCPLCTPHRAALMTGRFPTTTGMFLNDLHLPDRELCMAEIFAAQGYDTGYIGKWHLDGHGRSGYCAPEHRQGWDYWKVAECDHNYKQSHYYTGNSSEKQYWKGYDAFDQTRDAQEYLRGRAKADKPFILMLSFGPPHFPHVQAPIEYKNLYPPELLKVPPNVAKADWPAFRREAQGYYAHCTALDKCVGDVVATLDETGLARQTILVFTSDHGEMLFAHGEGYKYKQVSWDESARVPFLLRYPALGREARRVETPVTTPDILPTLLGLAGIAVPAPIEGEDLSGLLRTGGEIKDRAALYMTVAPNVGVKGPYRALRTSQYTYVRGLEGPWRLFDDTKDPWQMTNLVESAAIKDLVARLDQSLSEKLKAIGDNFRSAQEHLDEWGYKVNGTGHPVREGMEPNRRKGKG